MHSIEGPGRPTGDPPAWARLQRSLFDRQAAAVEPVMRLYLDADDEPFWPPEGHVGLDGVDDVLEGFYNWPLVYAMGGDAVLLDAARRAYEGALDRLGRTETPYGHPMMVDEYEQCRDWFHQGEGNQLLYNFGLAAPGADWLVERAERFAGFYFGDAERDGEPLGNFDPERRLIRGPQNGAMGPEYSDFELYEHHPYGADYRWRRHGLPWRDLDFADAAEDLHDPANEERLYEVLNERAARGDVPLNLAATSLLANAYLHTGDERYRSWVAEYVDAWRERTAANGGIVPDNVGRSGEVGEYVGGRWYGGKYGWSWGGWHYVGVGVTVGAENAVLLAGDREPTAFLRAHLDTLLDEAIEEPAREGADHTDDPADVAGPDEDPDDVDVVRHVPHKHGDPGDYDYHGSGLRDAEDEVLFRDGWYEFHPHRDDPYAVHLWTATFDPADRERVADLGVPHAWKDVRYRPAGKHGGGQEYSWLAYLEDRFPGYPRVVMEAAHERVAAQQERIAEENGTVERLYEDYLRDRNPVHEKALLQLTMGAPQPVYYGGLLHAQVRHFDPARERPGLPEDVAALVREVDADGVGVTLVNVGSEDREVVVQAGAYGEHRFTAVAPEPADGSAPAEAVAAADPDEGRGSGEGGDRAVRVAVPAGERVDLAATLDRHANDPTYAPPWTR
ncbi:MAG: hypothetical protein ABEJ42_02565 [Halobacteriaceae archaeon]